MGKSKQKKGSPKPQVATKNYTTLYADTDINITAGGKKIITESELVINTETKYFLIGHNGCGKTLLLNHINNKLKSTQYALIIDQDIKIDDTEQTVRDFILNANAELFEKHNEMVKLELLDEMSDDEEKDYKKLSEYIISHEWDKYEAESLKILNGLGFSDIEGKVSILSGGWRMRLALGKALLCKPHVLMLDEPTNHLDLNATIWLTDYLSTYTKTLIVVTHQIGLINSISDYVWFVGDPEGTGKKIYTVKGNYSNFLQTMEQIHIEAMKKYDKFQKQIVEMRNRKKNAATKKDVEAFIKKNNIIKPPKPYDVTISFENIARLNSTNVVELQEVGFSYDSKEIFNKVDFSVGMDSRYVIVGHNGAGKTTLFKLIMGSIKPNVGYIAKNEQVRIAYYHQQIIENLPLNESPIGYLKSINDIDDGECRGRLGRIGLKRIGAIDPCKVMIKNLSGGQKARVAFCAIQMSNPHIILMDEPSNHLDIESIEGLIKGINSFNGGIVIITHDTHLIDNIEKYRLYEVKNSHINYFNGDFDEYCKYTLK